MHQFIRIKLFHFSRLLFMIAVSSMGYDHSYLNEIGFSPDSIEPSAHSAFSSTITDLDETSAEEHNELKGIFRGEWVSALTPSNKGYNYSKTGKSLARLRSIPTALPVDMTFLSGELVLRDDESDAKSDSSHDLRYSLSGIYAIRFNVLLLFSHAPGWSRIPDLLAIMRIRNDTDAENFLAYESVETISSAEMLLQADTSFSIDSSHPRFNASTSIDTDPDLNSCRIVARLRVKTIIDGSHFEMRDGELYIRDGSPNWDQINVAGDLRSRNCNFGMAITSSLQPYDGYFSRAKSYATFISLITIAQLVLFAQQLTYSSSPARSQRVSIGCILFQALIDSDLCFFNLTTGILVDELWGAFVTAALMEFILFVLFELRFVMMIWKASNPEIFDQGINEIRRHVSAFHSKFYGMLFLAAIGMYFLQNHLSILMFIMMSFWWPQIITNCIGDHKHALQLPFIVGMTITRLCVPWYIFGYSSSIFNSRLSYNFCYWITIYAALQVWILIMQDHQGARFFVPHKFLPQKYNYWHDHTVIDDDLCAICMMELESDASIDGFMICPCNHVYHNACLERWMEQKMECPTCRAPLPPV